MKYIIVGTYKTNPEKCGWYINYKRYYMLWDKINRKIKGDINFVDCYYNSNEEIFGRIRDINNIYFYDFKTFDIELNGETKDKIVFKEKREDFVNGLIKLKEYFLAHPNESFRIGLQGNNVTGLFINYFNNNLDRINKVSLGTLAKDFKTLELGKIENIKKIPSNVEAFKIYNLTKPARSKNELKGMFNDSWNNFLEID